MREDIKLDQKNLIFLISQPRSGSTMLQHILAANSQVHTLPEPWLMLQLLNARQSTGDTTGYNAHFGAIALNEFLGRQESGDQLFNQCLRDTALTLYGSALRNSGKSRFLDKTPRYYFIISDLIRLFPNACFIFLVRNPVAVLASMISYNFSGDWWQMINQEDRRHDLLTAPGMVLEGVEMLGDRAAVVKYEDVVRDPAAEVEELCKKIGVEFEPEMLNYAGGQKFTDTTFVDTKSAYRHDTAVSDYVDAWKASLDCREKTDLARVYIEALGLETLRAYGEEPGQLLSELDALDSNMQKRTSGISRPELTQVLHHGEATLRRRTRLLSNWRFAGDEKSVVVKLKKSMSIILDGRYRWKTQ